LKHIYAERAYSTEKNVITYLGTRIEYSWIEVPAACWKVNNKFIQNMTNNP